MESLGLHVPSLIIFLVNFLILLGILYLRLLAGKVVELGFAPSISPETVRQMLKKTS